MNLKKPVPILLSVLLLSTSVYAAEGEPFIFEELDLDHNGAISREEANVRMDLVENFDTIDTNGNGSLSVDEYTAYHNKGRLVPEEVEVPEPGSAPLRR